MTALQQAIAAWNVALELASVDPRTRRTFLSIVATRLAAEIAREFDAEEHAG